ncbi:MULTISPECIES: ATP-binding protein [Microbacterium]|uniref:HTH luxR-type domain-containing protein n=1 Tax=Microbacterium wangchenii TaxID=2541726 RepID=A0ABX5SZL6_9MICO|nr:MULTISPECIES: LuxR C-terminal-related transcriptional regulator [Microbacterium]QBR90260.1 hypothetical protein E4K62_17190 [Microbacterium wangchenii]
MSGSALTPRERAVLAAVERRQTNPEIAAELFISVRTVESHIASLRRKLAAESRAALVAAARARHEGSVPVPTDTLHGRDDDLSAVRALLERHGWVTIVGPGGVGKTRLGLETAHGDGERTPLVVELEHAAPDDVATRIARALGLEATPGDLQGAVSVALAARPHLLLLDNADRVGPATVAVVGALRMRVPSVRVLVTSRTPLGAPGEAVHTLRPLGAEGADSPACALLSDRLRAAGADAGDPVLVARIAQRLDGLPLALELAASVARHLPLAELDARLARDLATLDRASPAGRHRSLDTAFGWTWDLLSTQEQDVLRRLAALPRTFDMDLAAAVTGPGTTGVVLRLLDHSLIVPTRTHPGRFRLLAVMREFVHARTEASTIREVLELHAVAVTETARAFIRTARTDASASASHRSAVLCPEVNAALRWMIAAGHPDAMALAADLAVGVEQYGADIDSIDALTDAARDEGVLASATPQQLLAVGMALAFVDIDLVRSLADRAAAGAADDDGTRAAEQLAAWAAAYRGDVETALMHCAAAERLVGEHGGDWDRGAILQARGIALRAGATPDRAAALAAFTASMRAYARAGDLVHVNNVRYMMASVAAEHPDDRERAIGWAAQARAAAEAMQNPHETAHAQLVQAGLGLAGAGDLGDLVDAFRRLGDLRCLHRALMLRAAAAAQPRERIGHLSEALEIATNARDPARQIAAADALVRALAAASDRIGTLAALDRLGALAGAEHARAACPAELLADFAGRGAPA